MKQLLCIKELAEMLKVSVPSLYRQTSQKLIPHIKLGGRVLFDPERIRQWLDSRAVEPEVKR